MWTRYIYTYAALRIPRGPGFILQADSSLPALPGPSLSPSSPAAAQGFHEPAHNYAGLAADGIHADAPRPALLFIFNIKVLFYLERKKTLFNKKPTEIKALVINKITLIHIIMKKGKDKARKNTRKHCMPNNSILFCV